MESGSFEITTCPLFRGCPLFRVSTIRGSTVNHNNACLPPYQLPPFLYILTSHQPCNSLPHPPTLTLSLLAITRVPLPPSWTHNGGSPGPPVHGRALPGIDRIVTQEQVNRILKTKHVKMKHHTKTNNKQNK